MICILLMLSVLGSCLSRIRSVSSISNSITNVDEMADYTFTFTSDSAISWKLVLTFPSEFTLSSSLTCSLGSCTVSGNAITIIPSSEISANVTTTLIISDVQNPSSAGGTGNFEMEAFDEEGNSIAKNKVFGVLGIAEQIGDLVSASVAIVSGGSSHAGDFTNYEFKLKLNTLLKAYNWLRFTFPDDGYYLSSFPTCASFLIGENQIEGELVCESQGNQVTLTQFTNDLPSNIDFGVTVTAKNPPRNGATGTFTIETGRNNTYTVYERKAEIAGVIVQPGRIIDIDVSPFYSDSILTKNKAVLYVIKFVLINDIEQGGWISLIFSNDFHMDYVTIRQVQYGLDDISAEEEVKLSYDIATKILDITNFAAYTRKEISLLLEINNPSGVGISEPIIIRSYRADGEIIDENDTLAYVTIVTESSPTSTSVLYPFTTDSQATGLNTHIQIAMFPQVEIPENGFLKIRVPTEFTVPTAPTCIVRPASMPENPAQSCSFLDNVITLQLNPSVGLDFGQFQATVESYIRIETITAPTRAGYYVFDFSTYSASDLLLESGTATAVMTASELPSLSLDAIHLGINLPTILIVSFTTAKELASGATPSETTELQGFIELSLPITDGTNNLFLSDLGLGVAVDDYIPCVGISGITNLVCQVTEVAGPVIITISEFDTIAAAANVEIHLPGIHYVQTANTATATVYTYEKENRIIYGIETGTATFPAGTTPTGVSAISNAVSSTDPKVMATTTFSGTFDSTNLASPTNPYLIYHINPTHDKGYCDAASVLCRVNSVVRTCTCYSEADMILVDLQTGLTGTTHTWELEQLVNPESVLETDEMKVTLIDNKNVVNYFTYSLGMTDLKAGSFYSPQVLPQFDEKGHPSVSYTFEMKMEHPVPAEGFLEVIFPAEYSLSDSSPSPQCTAKEITNFNCTIVGNIVRVYNQEPISSEYLVLVEVHGVKNPLVNTATFIFRSYNTASRIIDQDMTVPGLTVSDDYTPEILGFLDIVNNPDNANATAIYTFSFIPSQLMRAQSIISIFFPINQFVSLPDPPSCTLSGDLSTFETCIVLGNEVQITTNQDSQQETLRIDISGVKNFDEGTSDDFLVAVSYDGVTVQTTDSTTEFLTVESKYQASSLTVVSIDVYPRNIGEIATYEFNIIPQLDIESTYSIMVKFPSEYDQALGDFFFCSAVNLNGSIKCEYSESHTLRLYNHQSFTACPTCDITLKIYGVINPNEMNLGQFMIGTKMDNTFIEMNEFSGTVQLTSPPLLNILFMNSENAYARHKSTFSFDMTTTSQIPISDQGGEIWFRFPSEYSLQNIGCTTSSYWAQGVPNCYLNNDRVIMFGSTQTYQGNLMAYVENTPHPLTEIYAEPIIALIYDDLNKIILDRSYQNLHPTRIQYTFPGPLILINYDEPFNVLRGTVSSFIPISLDAPCALNLTLLPTSTEFSFFPQQIYLQTGDIFNRFRASVPFGVDTGSYKISWAIENEIYPPYYTPIVESSFEVTSGTLVNAYVEDIMPVPRGGSSLAIKVYLDNAPDSDLQVNLSISGAHLSTHTLEFKDGAYEAYFTVIVKANSEESTGFVFLNLSGTNAESYLMTRDTVFFTIFDDEDPPIVTSISLDSVTRTNATFTATFSKVCYAYYVNALRGSRTPEFGEAKNGGPAAFYSTHSSYGNGRVKDNYQLTFSLFGLTAATKYSLFVYAEDLISQESEEPGQFSFSTDPIYKAAEVSLLFDQTFIDILQVDAIRGAIALVLSLHNWRVIEKSIETSTAPGDDVSGSTRVLADVSIQSSVAFYLIDNPGSDKYPTPKEMIEILDLQKEKLGNMLDYFDETQTIEGVEVYMDACEFESTPIVTSDSDYETIYISSSLKETGGIHTVIMKQDDDPGLPFSFQVFAGTDAENVPVANMSNSTEAGNFVIQKFENVEADTIYSIYVVCSNNYPMFPDVLEDSEIVTISWRTDPEPPPRPLTLNKGELLGIVALFYLF